MSPVNPLSIVSYKDVKLKGCGKFVILYETEYIWIYTRFYCFHTFKTKSNIIILWKKTLKIVFLCWMLHPPHWADLYHIALVVECKWSVVRSTLNLTIHVIKLMIFLHKIMIFTYRNFTNWNLSLLVLGKMSLFIDRYQNIWCSTTQPPNGLLWPKGTRVFFQMCQDTCIQNNVWIVTATLSNVMWQMASPIFQGLVKTTIVFLWQSRLNLYSFY